MTAPTVEANGYSLVCEYNIGTRVCMRMIFEGGRYGVNGSKVHDQADPMVEFYDVKAMHYNTKYGQILGCYEATELIDLLQQHPGEDVQMPSEKSVAFWKLHRYEKKQVLQWLKEHYSDLERRMAAFHTGGPEDDVRNIARVVHASMQLQSELQHLAGSRNGFVADVAIEAIEAIVKMHRRFERAQTNLTASVLSPALTLVTNAADQADSDGKAA